jgi:hypothetical protein
MKIKIIVLSLVLTVGASVSARAADKAAKDPAAMQAMMKKAMELGMPAEGHARLRPLAGRWTTKSKMWMNPGDKAQESAGLSIISWVLDGRYLRQDYSGNWAGQPFQGLGFLGYDNVRREYVNIWMDNMSTTLVKSSGQYEAKSNSIKDEGTYSCMMTGDAEKWFRAEWKLPESEIGQTSVYTMFSRDEEGKEFKSMEIVYTRMK